MTTRAVEMPSAAGLSPLATPRAADASDARQGHLFHPIVDFLGLGGASLIVLPLIAWLLPVDEWRLDMIALMVVLSHFINYPHFAHSYQIFYRNFRRKAFGADYTPNLRARYIVAGFVVPAALALFFAASMMAEGARMLGLGGNIMAFLVGWHYVKQGYGMAIVDSVLKRKFYSGEQKRLLQTNAYACWLVTWLGVNRAVSEETFWGVNYYTFAIPEAAWYCACAIVTGTTLMTIAMLVRKWRADGRAFPLNGAVAYMTTLYAWVVFAKVNLLVALFIPAFHSLQYMFVVWRYQLNLERSRAAGLFKPKLTVIARVVPSITALRFGVFVILGILLGYIGFWFLPSVLTSTIAYDTATFGPTMFVFMAWIFINVHHFFIDNVMWRRENPEARKYLFAHH